MPARSSLVLSRSRHRRTTDWEPGPTSIDQTVSASASLLWTTGTTPGHAVTIVRIRGMLDIYLTVASAAGDGFSGATGICVVAEDAFAVGVTAVPKPLDDLDSDMWMWHHFFDVHALTVTLTDGVNAVGAHLRIPSACSFGQLEFCPSQILIQIAGFRSHLL